MRVLNAFAHGVLDYVVVVVLLLAPTLFHFTWLPALVAYLLAAVHLAVSLCTRYRLGVFRRIPFGAHGLLEAVVSVALVALPWVAGFADQTVARSFYVAFGILLFVVWLITDYAGRVAHAAHAGPPAAGR